MSRSKEPYIIEIRYPDSNEGIIKLRKKVVEAWDEVLKTHIKFLSIGEREKKKIYEEIMKSIVHYKENDEN